MKPSKLQAALSSHQSGRESRQDGDALGTAGHALDALGHVLEYLDAHAVGATVSEREMVPSAVDVTVEEWEALASRVVREWESEPYLDSQAQHRALVQGIATALRNAGRGKASAISKSETTQPATGDGTGEDSFERAQRHNEYVNKAYQGGGFNDRSDADRATARLIDEAREIGTRAEREHLEPTLRLANLAYDELQEKLAAAETRERENGAKMVEALNERDEMREQFGVECAGRQAAEQRAEKAEARVALLEPVASAAYEWTGDYEREELSRPVELRLFDAVACNLIKVGP